MTNSIARSPNTVASPMDAGTIRRRLISQILVLLGVTFLAVLTSMALDQQIENYMPEGMTFPSVFNRKPSGTSGALELPDGIHIVSSCLVVSE